MKSSKFCCADLDSSLHDCLINKLFPAARRCSRLGNLWNPALAADFECMEIVQQLTDWESPPAATDSEPSEKGAEGFSASKRFRTGLPSPSPRRACAGGVRNPGLVESASKYPVWRAEQRCVPLPDPTKLKLKRSC
jgi:hypothetical protein